MRKMSLSAMTVLSVLAVFILSVTPVAAADDPIAAFKRFVEAGQDGDWDTFWDGCEDSTQQKLGKAFLEFMAFLTSEDPKIKSRLEKEFGPDLENTEKMVITRDQFVSLMTLMWEDVKEDEKPARMFDASDVRIKERGRDRAVLVIKVEGKPEEEVVMVLRQGSWKYYMADKPE